MKTILEQAGGGGGSTTLNMKILTAPSRGQNLNIIGPFKLHLKEKSFGYRLKYFIHSSLTKSSSFSKDTHKLIGLLRLCIAK